MWSTRSNEFSRRCGLRVPSDMLALRNRGQRLVHGGRGAIHRNLAHAEMMVQTADRLRSEEHTSELQSLRHLVCRLLLEKKKPSTTARSSTASASGILRSK